MKTGSVNERKKVVCNKLLIKKRGGVVLLYELAVPEMQ